MKRLIIAAAVIGLLAACTTTGSGTSDPSTASASAAAASDTAAGTASAACVEAFAPIGELGIGSVSELGDLDEVDATIVACESIADWRAGASGVVGGELREGAVQMLLAIRCDDPGLADTAICQELS